MMTILKDNLGTNKLLLNHLSGVSQVKLLQTTDNEQNKDLVLQMHNSPSEVVLKWDAKTLTFPVISS